MTMSKYVASLRSRMTYFTMRDDAIADNKRFIKAYLNELNNKIHSCINHDYYKDKIPARFHNEAHLFQINVKTLEELAEMLFYLEYKPGSFSTRGFTAYEIFEIIISFIRPSLHQIGEVGLSHSQIHAQMKEGNENFFHSNIATLAWKKRNFAQLLIKNVSNKKYFLPLLRRYNRMQPVYVEVKDKNVNTVSNFIEYKSELHKVCDEFLAKDFGADKGLMVSQLPFFSAKDMYDKNSAEYKELEDYLALEDCARDILAREGL